MYKFSIGIITDSLRLPVQDAIKTAAELGATGIQMYAVDGATSPQEMSSQTD